MSNEEDKAIAAAHAEAAEHDMDPKLELADETKARRAVVEKRLKRKLDLRCSLFVLIYILSEYAFFPPQKLVDTARLSRQEQYRCRPSEWVFLARWENTADVYQRVFRASSISPTPNTRPALVSFTSVTS
jgi:hypothetical protein